MFEPHTRWGGTPSELLSCRQPRHIVQDVKCCVCRSREGIISYPAHDHTRAICPDCCGKSEAGHDFDYDRWDGWYCLTCGISRDATDYEHDPG